MASHSTQAENQLVPPVKSRDERELWPEPLDTPGYIPRHMKRSATVSFPILEVIQRLLYRLRSRAREGDIERILALIGLHQAIRPIYRYLKDFLIWAFTVQVTIPETDQVAKEVLSWMGSNVIKNSHTRSAMLVTSGAENMNLNDGFPRRMMMPHIPIVGAEQVDDEVVCLPPIGTRLFWVGFRPFLFSRRGGTSSRSLHVMSGHVVDGTGQLQNSLTIMTLGWSLKPLQEFTALCHQFKLENLTGTTTVYFAGRNQGDAYGDAWQCVSKAIRKLDTIDMEESVKSDLIKDAEYYYSDESRKFFADCGIPYRPRYLFHGPPGTGKSSFSAALAGHLNCDIYHINLATGDITDGGLHRLFLGLPRKCIVVIEDIDSAGIGREHSPMTEPEPVRPGTPDSASVVIPVQYHRYRGKPRNMVTLSGLLNAIDGNASQEGRLLIMTSNNPEVLDAALTRPGRIDKKVYFGNLTKSAGKSIFKRLIGRSALAHDAAFTMEQIEQFATDFAEKVPANTFTPAQVQNFLQGCRGDPHRALADIEPWVESNRPRAEKSEPGQANESSASVVENHVDAEPSPVPLDDEKFNLVQPVNEV